MEQNLTTVDNSIDFRDVVMTLDREGHGKNIFVRRTGTQQTYRVIPRHTDPFQKIGFADLFLSNVPPIYMEDFAQMLIGAESTGTFDVYTC